MAPRSFRYPTALLFTSCTMKTVASSIVSSSMHEPPTATVSASKPEPESEPNVALLGAGPPLHVCTGPCPHEYFLR